MNDKLYNFLGQQYDSNIDATLDKLCNAVNVINIGTSVCFVNGIPLSPPIAPATVGDSYNVGGNRGEIFTGRLNIRFTGGTGLIIVVQKFYLPDNL